MSKESNYYFSSKVLFEPVFWGLLVALMGYVSLTMKFGFLYGITLAPIGLVIVLHYIPHSLRKTYYYFVDRPAITITAERLIDNINLQEYKWSEIYGISYHTYRKTIDISIGELDKQKYIDRASWFLSRLVLKLNLDISRGTFHIGKQYSDPGNALLNELIQTHGTFKK